MEGFCQLYLPKLNGRKVLGREKENMYRKDSEGWLKHADFIVLDMICLQLAFILAYAFRGYGFNVYGDILYRNMAIFLGFADLVVIFTSGTMKSVLKRGHYKEFVSTLKNAVAVGALAIAYLFIIQEGQSFSRMILITTIVIYLIFTYAIREIWKNSLHKKMENGGDKKLLIITSKAVAKNVVHSMQENNYARYSLAGVVVIDEDCTGEKICGVPVVAGESDVPMYVCQEWIDEVLIVISENLPYPDGLIDKLTETGVTVHLNLAKITNQTGKRQFVEKVGSYTVLTTSLNYASFGQLFLKRLMDICGGLVGCIFTGIITIFVGPAIYLASPGPIFFSQERVGKNGKKFKMYKFRSMYMDAEARKAELMKENKLGDGKMFKMDFDPRVIGNKVLPDGTHKTGVGDFIRRTSLDEFPQFFNVLKGDGLNGLFAAVFRAIAPTVGQAYAKGDEHELNKKLDLFEFITFISVYFCFTLSGLLITPFVQLYTNGITDVDYIQPIFGVLIVMAEGLYLIKEPHLDLSYSANKFKELSVPAFVEAGINILVSIILVHKLGLIGVAIGTIAGMTYRMAYQIYFTTKIVKNRKQWIFYKKLLAFSFVTLIGVAICHFVPLTEITVWNWVLHAFIYALIFGVLYLILSLLLFKKDVRYLKEYILK